MQKALSLTKPGSAIVINGSIAGIKGVPAFGVYAATVVSPGTVATPAYRTELGLGDEQIEEFSAQAAAITPPGRTGTVDEIAAAVAFLASDDASYITGIELFVDGGQAQI